MSLAKTNIKLPSGSINPADSFQTFLSYNNLTGNMDWGNTYHIELWEQWRLRVKTFEPHKFMPISPNNSGFNH